MEKIILYYHFCQIADPKITQLWQLQLCQNLNLKGRIIVSPFGINGTLGGLIDNLKAYKKALNELTQFRSIDYKWSDGRAADFPKLSVKVRPELVTLQPAQPFDALQSKHGLNPHQWHQYLKDNPKAIVLDARNSYESDLGYFKVENLIKPKIKAFKEIKTVVKNLPKDQPILTYCTGDVRCEYLSTYMHSLGFKTVHHLLGGIMKYGQLYGDSGFWQGKCYVFDKRMNIGFSDQALDLAVCLVCGQSTSHQVNCDDCNQQLVVCLRCQQKPYYHCQSPTVSSLKR